MLVNKSQITEEDLAVSSLLEIDSKELQDLNIWEEKKINKVQHKPRRYSFHKQPYKIPHPSKITQQGRPHLASSQSNYPQSLKQLQRQESATMNPQEQSSNCNLNNKKSGLNQQKNWHLQINSVCNAQKKVHCSQPKLTKKLSNSHQSGNRKSYQDFYRYGDDYKTSNQQYKTNHIYSLLTNKDIIQHKYQTNFIHLAQKHKQANAKVSPLQKITKKSIKNDTVSNLNNQVQNYMKETLKKLYLKNRSDEYNSSQSKQTQQQRSSMVRQLLINLKNVKDAHNLSQTHSKENQKLNFIIEQGSDQTSTNTVKKIERKFYHQYNNRHILNLNQQAQKMYENRSTNQTVNKTLLIKLQ